MTEASRLLGVISDTHGRVELTEQAVRKMQSLGVREALHCGDVGPSAIVELFEPLTAHFVQGNCDSSVRLRMAVEAAGQTYHGRLGEIEVLGRKIAFLHGDSPTALQRLLAEGECDLICHGHTHQAESYTMGTTMILNPGAMTRCQTPSIALVRLPDLKVTPITL